MIDLEAADLFPSSPLLHHGFSAVAHETLIRATASSNIDVYRFIIRSYQLFDMGATLCEALDLFL